MSEDTTLTWTYGHPKLVMKMKIGHFSENENQHDKFAVAIVLEERIVGHVPKNLSKIFHQFMKIPNCTIGCIVIGKRVNRGAGYGLEIPVQYRFIGAEKAVQWAKKNIKKFLKT